MPSAYSNFHNLRIGQGYDLHRLKEGTGLYLGGCFIPCTYATIAHSDGDVLCHAAIDSLLGALALGDIGAHFPPSEEQWQGVNSLEMLRSVYADLVQPKGFFLLNLDCTVVLEKVHLRAHIDEIRAHLLGGFLRSVEPDERAVAVEQISVKAKTKEGADAVGCGTAIEAYACCLLQAQNE